MVAATSDWHLGDNGDADDSNELGILWVVESAVAYGITDLVIVGDMTESWQFALPDIIAAKRILFQHLNGMLSEAHVTLHVVRGNHDPVASHLTAALGEVLPDVTVLPHEDHAYIEGTQFLHGHQWDVWNKPGALQYISHGAAWFAGVVERVFPGFDENAINPNNWFSPAKHDRQAIHDHIVMSVDEYARSHGFRVCYGHTHRPFLSETGRVVNVGCCVNEKASFAVLFDDGNINLVRKEEP